MKTFVVCIPTYKLSLQMIVVGYYMKHACTVNPFRVFLCVGIMSRLRLLEV